MTKTEVQVQKIEVGATFGYREVTAVGNNTVTYRNLNGRKPASGKSARKAITVSKKEFRALVGLD